MDIKIKDKIKNAVFIAIILICGIFLVAQGNVSAQDYEWEQVNTSGFGDIGNNTIATLTTFGNYLYAGTNNSGAGTGGEIWRTADGSTWNRVVSDGFGDSVSIRITSLASYNGYLYAGTANAASGTAIWRSANGTSWSAIVATGEPGAFYNNGFNDNFNTDLLSIEVFNGYLYAGTQNGKDGGEIWRTNNGTAWSQVNTDGFGSLNRANIYTLETFNNNLYAGTGQFAEIWYCTQASGCNAAGDWDYVVGDGPPPRSGGRGFGDNVVQEINKLINFGGYLYSGTDRFTDGGELWRSSNGSSWLEIVGDGASIGRGFGDNNNINLWSSVSSNGYLYFGTINTNGAEIWRSANGSSWNALVATGESGATYDNGFGDSNNDRAYAMNEFDDHLYVGTYNTTDGGEIWRMNYVPEGSAISALQSTDGDGKVNISFSADDIEGTNLQARIEYNIGSGWQKATISTTDSETTAGSGDPNVNNSATYQLNTISTSGGANDIETVWNSNDDVPTADVTSARVRIRLYDTISLGDWIVSAAFDLDNVGPNPPTLNAVTSPTNIDTQVISGGKDANASVLLGGTEIVAINASTTWSYNLDLLEGNNSFSLTSEDDKGNESSATTGSIILDTEAPNTEANPPGGTYTGILDEVIISSDEVDTTIYYTLDGSDPDLGSDIYSDPLEIANNTTLKFFGVDSLGNQEAINEEVYVLVDAAVRLTKSVSVESAEAAAAPINFKYSGLVTPSVIGGLNNLKTIIFRSLDFIKYPNYELYQKIAQVLLILLFISFGGAAFLMLFKKIKNSKISDKKPIKSFEFAYSSHKKIFFGLVVFVSIFALSESLIAIHMLSAADSEVERGDTLIYQINYQNIGTENVREFYFVDSIPLFTEYITGSMQINEVAVTDANDFDNADYNSTWAGHAYFNIGDLAVGASGNIVFRVRVSDIAADGSLVSNRAVGGYNPGGIRVESNTVSNNVSVESVDEEDSDSSTSSDSSSDSSTTSGRRGGPISSTTEDSDDSEDGGDSTDDTSETKVLDDDSFINKSGNNIDKNTKSVNQIIEETKKTSLYDNLGTINKFAIAPILTLLTLLNLFSTFSLSSIIPLLRYIWQVFTEPLLYFGNGKRKGWGVVYDSQTKKPIDLALVRLYNKETKKLIETKVTDFEGRYVFIVESGAEYYLEVQKYGYSFPSKMLSSVQSDKNYKNIYHGETIEIDKDINNSKKEKGYIAYEIPIDLKEGMVYNNEAPHKLIKTDIRNIEELDKASDVRLQRDNNKILSAVNNFKIHKILAYIGPILGLISFILTPSLITFALLLLHLLMLIFFVMLARKKDKKTFGRVYNKDNNNPLSKSVVRLFDSKYGRLLSTTVSKSDGRYGFLAGDNKYLLNSTKEGFIFPEGKIEIIGEKQGIIKENLGMRKSQE